MNREKLTALNFVISFLIVFFINSCRDANPVVQQHRTYFPTGELQHELTMVDSLLHGSFTSYYKNGKVEYEKNFDMDSPIGDHYYYSRSGKLLEYELYDLNGELRYQLVWDSLKDSYEEEGKPLYVQGTFQEEYKVGDTISILPIVANPHKSAYIVGLLSRRDSMYKTYPYVSPNSPLFLHLVDEKGDQLSVVSAITGTHNGVLRRDTSSFSIFPNR